MPEYPLAPWIARELDRLEALNAAAAPGPWQVGEVGHVAPTAGVCDVELAAAARNLVGNLVGYGRALLADHAPCVIHRGCTVCRACDDSPEMSGKPPAERYPCLPVRRFGAVFAHRPGYRMFEWMP